MLLSLGVPDNRIFMDDKVEIRQKRGFSKELPAAGLEEAHSVTSAFHMPRAARFLAVKASTLCTIRLDYHQCQDDLVALRVVPQSAYLLDSCLAIKEYVGIAAASLGMQ